MREWRSLEALNLKNTVIKSTIIINVNDGEVQSSKRIQPILTLKSGDRSSILPDI
jgi:hypothetical protein